MWRSLVARILLVVSLFMSAPRPTFWRDVSQLRYSELSDEEVCDSIRSVPDHFAATWTEFYCNPINGSNLNGGSDSGSPSMSDTAGTGSWTSATNIYVSVATTGTVTVGQFMSIYSSGAVAPAYTARVTVVTGGSGSAWTITLSATAFTGVKPSTAATYFAQVGGAWQGPTGTNGWPIASMSVAAKNATGNFPRVNLKNNGVYSITASITVTTPSSNYIHYEGYTSSPGDGGRATIDGGTTGASYNLINFSNAGTDCEFVSLVFQNNGSTGSAAGLLSSTNSNSARQRFYDCVFGNFAGAAFSVSGGGSVGQTFKECEFYACNLSNTASTYALMNQASGIIDRCFFHDNLGSNTGGLSIGTGAVVTNCVFSGNGKAGIGIVNSGGPYSIDGCDFYNNGGSGIDCSPTTSGAGTIDVENCNFVKNDAEGINLGGGCTWAATVTNCGFGSGTQANTSGQVNSPGVASGNATIIGSITYASGVTPWVDPVHGNFNINLAAAENTGRGNFTQTPYLTGSITNATNASPIVVTSAAHGLTSGAIVVITGVGGNTNANATWTVNVVDANTFNLIGSSGNSAYTSGGAWTSGPNSNWTAAVTLGYPDVGAAQQQSAASGPIGQITGARSIGTY